MGISFQGLLDERAGSILSGLLGSQPDNRLVIQNPVQAISAQDQNIARF